MNLLAVVSLAVCWGAFALAWLVGAIFYESRAPAERTRSWFGSSVPIGIVVITAVSIAVPRADWASVQVPQLVPGLRLPARRKVASR